MVEDDVFGYLSLGLKKMKKRGLVLEDSEG